MSYSEKVCSEVYNLDLSFKRQREIIYKVEISPDQVIQYMWGALVNHIPDDTTTHGLASEDWFHSLTEEEQLKVISLFNNTVCRDYVELINDEEEVDDLEYEDFRYTEDDESIDKTITDTIADNLKSDDEEWLSSSIDKYRQTLKQPQVQEPEVKQIIIPYSTVEEEIKALKEENARLKATIEAMKKVLTG